MTDTEFGVIQCCTMYQLNCLSGQHRLDAVKSNGYFRVTPSSKADSG